MGTEEVLKALGNVQEPDLKKDLVTLNMVRDIIISESSVEFTVVLTTPACPMKELISQVFATILSENIILALGQLCGGKPGHVFHQSNDGNLCLGLREHRNGLLGI